MTTVDLKSNKHLLRILRPIAEAAEELNTEVYLVGGSVRDLLMKRKVTDLDFVVVGDGIRFANDFASRNGITKVVSYQRFGTALVPFHGYHLEFVGARSEEYESDSRNPLVSKADLKSDLTRRDFTINTLAVKIDKILSSEIVDIFNGFEDLQAKIIRTPRNPEETFYDDPLRILRAARFAAQLDCTIESNVLAAMNKMSNRLKIISVERIAVEFKKLLLSAKPAYGMQILAETGLLPWIIPELETLKGIEEQNGMQHKEIFDHTLEVLTNVAELSDDFSLRIAALLHDIAKPVMKKFDPEKGWTFYGHAEEGAKMVGPILQRLRYSNDIIEKTRKLVLLHQRPGQLAREEATDSAYRRLNYEASNEVDDMLILSRADISTRIPGKKEMLLESLDRVVERLAEIEEKDHLQNFQAPVPGEEIMDLLHLEPGVVIGNVKDDIREAILEGIIPNQHDAAVEFILKNKSKWLES